MKISTFNVIFHFGVAGNSLLDYICKTRKISLRVASPWKVSEILNTEKNTVVSTFPFHSVPASEPH